MAKTKAPFQIANDDEIKSELRACADSERDRNQTIVRRNHDQRAEPIIALRTEAIEDRSDRLRQEILRLETLIANAQRELAQAEMEFADIGSWLPEQREAVIASLPPAPAPGRENRDDQNTERRCSEEMDRKRRQLSIWNIRERIQARYSALLPGVESRVIVATNQAFEDCIVDPIEPREPAHYLMLFIAQAIGERGECVTAEGLRAGVAQFRFTKDARKNLIAFVEEKTGGIDDGPDWLYGDPDNDRGWQDNAISVLNARNALIDHSMSQWVAACTDFEPCERLLAITPLKSLTAGDVVYLAGKPTLIPENIATRLVKDDFARACTPAESEVIFRDLAKI